MASHARRRAQQRFARREHPYHPRSRSNEQFQSRQQKRQRDAAVSALPAAGNGSKSPITASAAATAHHPQSVRPVVGHSTHLQQHQKRQRVQTKYMPAFSIPARSDAEATGVTSVRVPNANERGDSDSGKGLVQGEGAEGTETDLHRLRQRQKDIDFGKNTRGYDRYACALPKRKRESGNPNHPHTPDPLKRMSRRAWVGRVKAWRRALHTWDPPEQAQSLAAAAAAAVAHAAPMAAQKVAATAMGVSAVMQGQRSGISTATSTGFDRTKDSASAMPHDSGKVSHKLEGDDVAMQEALKVVNETVHNHQGTISGKQWDIDDMGFAKEAFEDAEEDDEAMHEAMLAVNAELLGMDDTFSV